MAKTFTDDEKRTIQKAIREGVAKDNRKRASASVQDAIQSIKQNLEGLEPLKEVPVEEYHNHTSGIEFRLRQIMSMAMQGLEQISKIEEASVQLDIINEIWKA